MEQLNASISKTLYDQLADQIRYDIYEGKFKQGEKIPSEFELSDIYGVSRSTVVKQFLYLFRKIFLKKHTEKELLFLPPKRIRTPLLSQVSLTM